MVGTAVGYRVGGVGDFVGYAVGYRVGVIGKPVGNGVGGSVGNAVGLVVETQLVLLFGSVT